MKLLPFVPHDISFNANPLLPFASIRLSKLNRLIKRQLDAVGNILIPNAFWDLVTLATEGYKGVKESEGSWVGSP